MREFQVILRQAWALQKKANSITTELILHTEACQNTDDIEKLQKGIYKTSEFIASMISLYRKKTSSEAL
jgi:hypothetical protein